MFNVKHVLYFENTITDWHGDSSEMLIGVGFETFNNESDRSGSLQLILVTMVKRWEILSINEYFLDYYHKTVHS